MLKLQPYIRINDIKSPNQKQKENTPKAWTSCGAGEESTAIRVFLGREARRKAFRKSRFKMRLQLFTSDNAHIKTKPDEKENFESFPTRVQHSTLNRIQNVTFYWQHPKVRFPGSKHSTCCQAFLRTLSRI